MKKYFFMLFMLLVTLPGICKPHFKRGKACKRTAGQKGAMIFNIVAVGALSAGGVIIYNTRFTAK